MPQRTLAHRVAVDVGSMSRGPLLEALQQRGVRLNESARVLLGDPIFDQPMPESVTVVERSVSELGFPDGAVLSQILAAAPQHDLQLCPPTLGPYLRLALLSQPTAPDAVMSNGRVPSGSLTVAAAPLRDDDDYPKGFYLRVITDQPWLRGYRCGSSDHVWDPDDRFVFRCPVADRTVARRTTGWLP